MSSLHVLRPSPFFDRGIYQDPRLPEGISFTGGRPIQSPVRHLVFESNCDHEHPPRHMMGSGYLPVVSKKLLECLQQLPVDSIQSFPASNNGLEKIKWDNYFALNIETVYPANSFSERSTAEHPHLFRIDLLRSKLISTTILLEHLEKTVPPEGWGLLVDDFDEAWQTIPPVYLKRTKD